MATPVRRRADAERSIARIISAARSCLSSNPNATIDDIAREAGVGRMTLYGHFRSRAELVEAALADALGTGETTLSEVDLEGNARDAMQRLLESSWELVAESSALLEAAEDVLPPNRIRELHAAPADRLEQLVRRGQTQGVFRSDMPLRWLVSAAHYLMHGAAAERRAGRLSAEDAARVVTESIQSLFAPPPTRVLD